MALLPPRGQLLDLSSCGLSERNYLGVVLRHDWAGAVQSRSVRIGQSVSIHASPSLIPRGLKQGQFQSVAPAFEKQKECPGQCGSVS